jgi:O-antigen/teichoic acid export membrane protein
MSRTLQVARGTLRLLGGQVLARGLDFVLYLVLCRALAVEEFGHYVYALSFTLLFNVLADCGVSTVLTREAARASGRARSLLERVIAIKLALAVVTAGTIFTVALLTQAPPTTLALMGAFAAAMILNSMAGVFDGLLRAAGRAGRAGLSLVTASAAGLILAGILFAAGAGLAAGAAACVVAAATHLATALWSSRDLWSLAPAGAADEAPGPLSRTLRALLREAAPVAVSGVFIALYFRIDSVMLHMLQGERAVGLYGGIYRLFEAFTMIAVAFRSVLFPVMARAGDGPRAALAVLCRKSLRVHLLFTALVAVFITCEAPALLRLLLGGAYEEAAPGLRLLIWALPAAFMADTMLHLLIAQRLQGLATWAVGAAAVFNIALNLILIPAFSFVGASVATVASEILCFSILFALFSRSSPGVSLAPLVGRPLLAAGVVGAGLMLVHPHLPSGLPGLAVAAAGALLVYLMALALLGAIGRDDLALVRALLPAARGGSRR